MVAGHAYSTNSKQRMKLVDDLVLMLLNEETGYMEQVAGWNVSCAIAGALLADLSLEYRIDMDMESLTLLDAKPTGDDLLDSVLANIAATPEQRNTVQYWVEKNAPTSDEVLEKTLDGLTSKGILTYESGGFWSLAREVSFAQPEGGDAGLPSRAATKRRIIQMLLSDEIPDPRDVILIGLVNACDAFRFIFMPEEYQAARERIQIISNMDLVGRSVGIAVAQSSLQLSLASRPAQPIPKLRWLPMLRKESLREGNSAKFFADIYRDYGPVVEARFPFGRRVVILVGNAVNEWVNRRGRLHLRSKEYMTGLEQVFGAQRSLPGMDGAEHFRMRKAQRSAFSLSRLWERVDDLYGEVRSALRAWEPGATVGAVDGLRQFTAGQTSQLTVGVDASDVMADLQAYMHRAQITHAQRVLPRFLLKTPRMRRTRRGIDDLQMKIQAAHTSARRMGRPRDRGDDLISLHNSDPHFFPQTDMTFGLVMPLVVALYMANGLAFHLYNMISRPDIYRRVQAEADALFENGDPQPGDYSPQAIDVTRRLILESSRLYPSIPLQMRNVMNACVVEGYEIPAGTRVLIGSTAPHYMAENYPEPLRFDIDRYLPERSEHRKAGAWGLYGLGTHTCLGHRWADMQIAINVLLIAHHFDLELPSPDHKLQLNPFPTNAPRKNLKFHVRALRHAV